MTETEIDVVRAMLASRPRPVGWLERRARLDEVGTAAAPAPDIAFTPVEIGGVPCEWSLAPGSDPGRVVLFFHGGGFCSGSIASHRRLVSEAGRAAGARTLAVGYRLAPEHPFPAAQDDALAVWTALTASGLQPDQVTVAGDSAGGSLAVALVGQLRGDGRPGPGAIWLVSPWADLTMSGVSMTTKDGVDPLIHRSYLEELSSAYAPADLDRAGPRLSVLNADLAGFPPLLIQVGSAETLLDDAVRLAGKAGAADVRVTLEVWPDMIHAFPLWNAQLADGRAAIARAGMFIKDHG